MRLRDTVQDLRDALTALDNAEEQGLPGSSRMKLRWKIRMEPRSGADAPGDEEWRRNRRSSKRR